MRQYTLFWNVMGKPPGGIRVTADVPASWTETIDGMGSPRFALPGGGLVEPTIVAIHAPGATADARLAWAIEKQFGADLAAVTRAPRSGGRIWAVHRKPSGHVHARMFLPAPHDSVVMCVAMLPASAAAALAQIEPVFETVRVGTA